MDHVKKLASVPAVLSISVILIALFAVQVANPTVTDRLSLSGDASVLEQEPWSLLTVMFVHANAVHLGLMVLMLTAFGTRLEVVARSRDVFAVYVLAGLAGSLGAVAAAFVMTSDGTLVGASAAVFGVAAAVLARQPTARMYGGTAVQWLTMLVGINVVLLALQPLSAAAHLAGLAVGAGYGRWLHTPGHSGRTSPGACVSPGHPPGP